MESYSRRKRRRKNNTTGIVLAIALAIVAILLIWFLAKMLKDSLFGEKKKSEPVKSIYSWNLPKEEGAEGEGEEESQGDENGLGQALSDDACKAKIDDLIANMSLREKICQLMVVTPSSVTGYTYVVAAGDATKEAIEEYPVGGFFYDESNYESDSQLKEMLTTVQGYSKIPLLLATNEEGGDHSPLFATAGVSNPGNAIDFKDATVEIAEKNARTMGDNLKSFGFNMNLSPLADVPSGEDNEVLGKRAYAYDYEKAAELIPGAVTGYHRSGIISVLKHFPGIGSIYTDTETEMASSGRTMEELRGQELKVFEAGIKGECDGIILANAVFTGVESEPVMFSQKLIGDTIRNELGFTGVVMTDYLDSEAITSSYAAGDIAVKALNAGVDLFLRPADISSYVTAIETAVTDGTITEERIDESVRRILIMKMKCRLI